MLLIYIFFNIFFFFFLKHTIIEKCSESTGINCFYFFLILFLIKFHPQIIDSLFAIAIFFVYLIIFNCWF